jgi:cytochrome c556
MDRHQELLQLVESFKLDFEKFYIKNNKSAGTRVRKHMADLKRKAQEIRNEVQNIKAQLEPKKEETPVAPQQ